MNTLNFTPTYHAPIVDGSYVGSWTAIGHFIPNTPNEKACVDEQTLAAILAEQEEILAAGGSVIGVRMGLFFKLGADAVKAA